MFINYINYLISKLFKLLGVKSNRTKNISKHILLSAFFKTGSLILNFLLIALTIDYLSPVNYGIWLIITSILSWFTFFDIGFGQGLRNKFTESLAKNNHKLAKAYVSSAYFSVGTISILLLFLFCIANFFIDWTFIFNTDKKMANDLSLIMMIVFSNFCLQFVFKLISTIYTADQRPSMQSFIGFLTNAFSLFFILLLIKYSSSSLLIFSLIFSILPVLILIFFNFYSFNRKYERFKPSFKLFKWKYVKDIMNIGLDFFTIQIASIILFSTDNFIITQLFGPEQVTPYNIALKYFTIITIGFSVIVTPFWSAITEAYTIKDFDWIKKSMNSLFKLSIFFSFLTFIMIFISEDIYLFWIGSSVYIPYDLTFLMGVYALIRVFGLPFNHFVNGTGKIKFQLYIATVGAIFNIPLSIFLAKNLELGLSGIILATILCDIIGLIILPIQYKKIINNRADGIWNR